MINIFMLNCAGGSSSSIEVSYKDTEANWSKTVDHCANVLIDEEVDTSGTEVIITKTYALLGVTDMTTVTFYRP